MVCLLCDRDPTTIFETPQNLSEPGEKEPGILYREQYKALLYEASDNPRDYAIIMTFLQTGIRLSELANLRLEDMDFENKVLTVRQGKGKKD
jgi:integrase/recombinase XerD